MPNIGELAPRTYELDELIRADPDCGRIVCFCERVTRAEVNAALAGAIPPVDADGLRRRTRALMGRCQGFFCAAEIARLEAMGIADGRSSFGGGPAGLAAAIELRRLGIGVRCSSGSGRPAASPGTAPTPASGCVTSAR